MAPSGWSNRLPIPAYQPGTLLFNVQNIGGKLYVTFAGFLSGKVGGFVDIFDTGGNFVKSFASMGQLNLPWGLAQAPGNFGMFSNDILVGNLGDGLISAFKPSGAYKGQLKDDDGQYISIDGLWALAFGTEPAANGGKNELFFTAGPLFYNQGLFDESPPRRTKGKIDQSTVSRDRQKYVGINSIALGSFPFEPWCRQSLKSKEPSGF
jgi:uncharacterized protein (TIGR03118 family)